MGQVIYIDPVALRRPAQYDHGHFLNSDGRCDLCQVRSLAEVMAERERREAQAQEFIRLTSK